MSEENLEIVRGFLDAAERGQWERAAEFLDPDVEQHGTVGGLEEGQVYRGLAEMIREYETVDLEAWEERRLEQEEFLHIDDLVVVLLHEYRRGRNSGVELEIDTAVIFTVRDRRVRRIQGYMDRGAALRAAGLSNVQSHRGLVEASTEAWNRADLTGWLDTFDPAIELRSSGAFPGLLPVYRGHDGLTAFWHAIHEPWASLRFELQRFAEGDGWTVGEFRFRATGASSGAQVDMLFCNASRIRDGRFVAIVAGRNFDRLVNGFAQEEAGA